ncbi:MAG TPA: ZIP family metal transporter [Thermoleophilaceae bacterium]|nr:ZIP family metal transporter [Thermoleophilaceae bacterium]
MAAALGWGALAASSLVLGALIGLARPWPRKAIGLVLGFGAGALISAVSFELAEDGVKIAGGLPVAIGLGVGALTYFVASGRVAAMGGGPALALGAFLDGIPEQMVLGIGLAGGEKVSIGLLAAIYVSNLPEGVGGATELEAAGRSRRQVLRLWTAVAVACALATPLGFALMDIASDDFQGGLNGFAAGALLVMLVDTMIPDATEHAGRTTGLVTTLGFAVGAGLSLA